MFEGLQEGLWAPRQAWRQGRTGYPLVDAAMRELWSTGWIHNRMRVVCASFLVKNLLLPWQWGLKHFWDAQLDADLESAALGWQYVSGCLAGAACHHLIVLKPLPGCNHARLWCCMAHAWRSDGSREVWTPSGSD